MLAPRLPRLPDDWVVWAFTDPHGVVSGLTAALREAGLIDGEGRWSAPPRTALVGCGDYLDRGGDVRGMIELLRRLQTEAETAAGAVVLARGNHEAMPLMIHAGGFHWLETWLRYGGEATVASLECDEVDPAEPERLIAAIDGCAPGLFEWLASLHEAIRWRDVLFVHGGLAPGYGPHDLGTRTDEHLWVRSAFFDTPWEAPDFEAYRAAGIERVVFGHTPQPEGPTLHHEGHSLGIDTNAVGNPRLPDHAVQQLTLLGLGDGPGFDDSRLVTVETRGAPDQMRRS